ncbi:uncharacterized protein DUF3307 [Halanaerobium saccharolyticum]|uniref:Uncharacterized protein DUF3307 n=1 Tax=Halanaerobium saccharolyticum TaxID=43595 RepID=A0A4R7YM14_9FIRM|nr:DUF3307 domain-containing protein [Halanaerobium saccharolyticum]RAK04163.1 uncharacterized protein DUF3307 [Halanaerobium saccharolyticum]TDV97958.1 uncharacterized protein DUF3307 [Halanaerobium saccharolyticum]TDX51019.1 uncharacterized protein DUF3307 [Halanaerobium saccharolyticum]
MLYSLLILAHILSDFTFQSENTSKNKRKSNFTLLKHGIIVFVISYILTIYYFSLSYFFMILFLSLLHIAVDYIKVRLTDKLSNYSLELIISDQLLHLLVIFIITPFFNPVSNPELLAFFKELTNIYPALASLTEAKISFLLITLTVIIFNFKAATILVRETLSKYKSNITREGDKGEAIGNLERLLIIVFIFFEYYSLIGLMFTAKSLIRFKEIEVKAEKNSSFVEYYLIGSFISILIAISTGSLIKIFSYLWI